MIDPRRLFWEARHRDLEPGPPEPSVLEWLPLLRPGLALEVAAGRGRNSLALARAGFRVVAVDYSETGLRILHSAAQAAGLAVFPVVADLRRFVVPPARFDLVVNISFLERFLVASLCAALKPGGMLLFDTYLIDQAEAGAEAAGPSNPDYLLRRFELKSLLGGLELLRYREGLVNYPNGRQAWRAAALVRRPG